MSLSNLLTNLLSDGERFLNLARNCDREGLEELKLSYCRAVFFTSWSALEGWIKYISYSFMNIQSDISLFEKAFLMEKRIEINENGEIEIQQSDIFYPTLKKIQYIFLKIGQYDLKHENSDLWRRLYEIQRKRNEIVHPNTREEDLVINYDYAAICYNTIKETINLLIEKIYHE